MEPLTSNTALLHALLTAISFVCSLVAAGVLLVLLPQADPWLVRTRRNHAGKRIAVLTFDDGPDEPWTSQILDILQREGVPATFFVLGPKALRHPELLRRMAEEGHEIGNHTMSHRILIWKSWSAIAAEVNQANDAIELAAGVRPRACRPPHGFRTPFMRGRLDRMGLTLVPWTKGIWDTQDVTPQQLLRRFHRRIAPFEILLLHDGVDPLAPSPKRNATVEVLPKIIREYHERGYRFAKASELAELDLALQNPPPSGILPAV